MDGIRGVRFVSMVILVKGILNALLGALHVVGAFTFEAHKIAGQGTAEMRRDYILWFYAVGVFIVFMGLVDVFCYRGLRARSSWAWQISLLCAAFTTLTGLSGVVAFGISPPLQLLATGIVGSAALALARGEFRGGVS
jgi:hypothetical protein